MEMHGGTKAGDRAAGVAGAEDWAAADDFETAVAERAAADTWASVALSERAAAEAWSAAAEQAAAVRATERANIAAIERVKAADRAAAWPALSEREAERAGRKASAEAWIAVLYRKAAAEAAQSQLADVGMSAKIAAAGASPPSAWTEPDAWAVAGAQADRAATRWKGLHMDGEEAAERAAEGMGATERAAAAARAAAAERAAAAAAWSTLVEQLGGTTGKAVAAAVRIAMLCVITWRFDA